MLCWVVNADGSQIPFPSARTEYVCSKYFVAQTKKEQETGWKLQTPLPCISLQQCGTTVCIHGPGSVYSSMTMRCMGSAIQSHLPSIPMSKYKVHDAECMHAWWVVYLFVLIWNAWWLGWKWDSRAGLVKCWELPGWLAWPATELLATTPYSIA